VQVWGQSFGSDAQALGLYTLLDVGHDAAVRRKATLTIATLLRQSRLKATQVLYLLTSTSICVYVTAIHVLMRQYTFQCISKCAVWPLTILQ
jgi:hypothetical protein